MVYFGGMKMGTLKPGRRVKILNLDGIPKTELAGYTQYFRDAREGSVGKVGTVKESYAPDRWLIKFSPEITGIFSSGELRLIE